MTASNQATGLDGEQAAERRKEHMRHSIGVSKRHLTTLVLLRLAYVCAAGSLDAQPFPSKDYIRLGSRVIAIESPAGLTPPNKTNANSSGETGITFTIKGSPNSTWTTVIPASDSWISVTSGANGTTDGTGAGLVTYSLQANSGAARDGSIQVRMSSGTAVFSISQLGPIAVVLSRTGENWSYLADSNSVGVTAPATVAWTIGVQSCSITTTPVNGQGMMGSGMINYTVPQNNTGADRNCSFVVNSTGSNPQTFTVAQASAPRRSPSSAQFTSATGSGTISVSNTTGWSITSNATWLTVTAADNQHNSGSVSYSVAANTGTTQRTATLTFSGGSPPFSATFDVTQSGLSTLPAFSVSRTTMSFPGVGGNGTQDPVDYSVRVSTGNATPGWTASCNGPTSFRYYSQDATGAVSALCNTSGTSTWSSIGNQTVYVDASANTSTLPTSATITFYCASCTAPNSVTMTINQSPATLTIGPGSVRLRLGDFNQPIQFTAYSNGVPLASGVSWSVPSGYGSFASNPQGYYTPPYPVPNVGSIEIDASFSGIQAKTYMVIVTDDYAAQPISVTPIDLTGNGSVSGSGAPFVFAFQDKTGANGINGIETVDIAFSDPDYIGMPLSTNACVVNIAGDGMTGHGLNNSLPKVRVKSNGGDIQAQQNMYSANSIWNSQCSIAMSNTSLGVINSPVLTVNMPIQFYSPLAGTKRVWLAAQNQIHGTPFLFMGYYTVVPPTLGVSPATVTMNVNQHQQFAATASGTPVPDAYWTLSSQPTGSSISATGLYTAPSSIGSNQSPVTVSATRGAGGSAIGSAVITLSAVTGTVSPQSISLYRSQTQQFSASIQGTTNTNVTWSTSDNPTGITQGGLYSAPASIPTQRTVTITATSNADPSVTATAIVTLIPVSVSVSPATISLTVNSSQQFTATVAGSANPNVTWELSQQGLGTWVPSTGVYTAPATIAFTQSLTITARSVSDPTITGVANVYLVPLVVTISPSSITLWPTNQRQQFSALITGTNNQTVNQSVNWSMSPAVGSLTTGGFYTAPNPVLWPQTVTITASAQADTTASGSATVTLPMTIDLVLSNTTIGSGVAPYQAFNSIIAGNSFTINGSAVVTFTAAGMIRLAPGFQATAGSAATTFYATIH